MTVLLTGGCGFIGQYVARRLVEGGRRVVALDSLLPQVHADPERSRSDFPGEVIVSDVADPQTWADLTTRFGGQLSGIVHLAAETGTGQSMYELQRYHRVNVGGTRLAADFAQRLGLPLVSLSSRAVYGDGDPQRAASEDDPHRPVSVYGETKSIAEQALADLSIPVTVLRPQNVVGAGQALHNPYTGVLAAFVARLREGLPLVIYGDGRQTRDFVHVDDLAALVCWCLSHPPADGPRVLNSGTGTRSTLLELAEWTMSAAPTDRRPVEHLEVRRAGDIEHACADLTRLRRLAAEADAPLPEHSSRAAVEEFVHWSWARSGAAASAWDEALVELSDHGLIEPGPS